MSFDFKDRQDQKEHVVIVILCFKSPHNFTDLIRLHIFILHF